MSQNTNFFLAKVCSSKFGKVVNKKGLRASDSHEKSQIPFLQVYVDSYWIHLCYIDDSQCKQH